MGFELEDTVTLLAALSDTGMEASTAGTALKNIFLKLADPAGDLSKALGRNITSVEELVPALQELEANGVDVADMLEITDRRSVTAFASLLQGSEDLEILNKKLKESEGITKSFADTMRDTIKGSLDETKSAAEGFAIALIENLAPAINLFLEGIKGVLAVLTFLTPAIVGLTTAFVTYKTVMITARVMTYLYQASLVVARVASIAMTYGVRGLTLSIRAMNLAMKANPIGLLVGLAAGAIAVLMSMGDEVEEVSENVNELSEAEQRLKDKQDALERKANKRRKSQGAEIQNVRELIRVIKDETKERGKRNQAMKDLEKLSGITIKNLGDEVGLAKELEGAYNNAVDAIKHKYILQASDDNILKMIQQELKAQDDIKLNNEEIDKQTELIEKRENRILQKKEEIRKYMAYEDSSTKWNTIRLLNEDIAKLEDKIYFSGADIDRATDRTSDLTIKITELQVEQLRVSEATDKVLAELLHTVDDSNDSNTTRLTLHQKLKNAVNEEEAELTRLIIAKQNGHDVDEKIDATKKRLIEVKTKLINVDKEVEKQMEIINNLFEEQEDKEAIALEKRKETLKVDEDYLKVLDKLVDGGANLAEEQIKQALKVAKVKLDMALKVVSATEDVTDAEKENTKQAIINIRNLQAEIKGYESTLNDMGKDEGEAGWLDTNLFGSDEDGTGFTGADFLSSIAVTMDGVMGIMDEVNSLQQQNTDKKIGVIERAKDTEIEAFKETREYEVMNDKQKDAALLAISKKHDDQMLALKVAQWEKDKKFAKSSAIIAGAMAIMNIWSGQATGNVIADAIVKGIMTAAQVAMTGIQLAAINGQEAPTAELGGIMDNSFFAKGGMVHGNSHAQGGEKFRVGGRVAELEGGEAVINKRSTAMFKPMLSKMNVAGGGKKFADGGMMFGTDMLETQAVQMESLMGNNEPQQVLLVEADVTQSQRSVENIEAKASF